MRDASLSPATTPTLRERVEKMNDVAFLRGHVTSFVRDEIKAGRMLGPDKWKSNPDEAKKIAEAIFAKFNDVKKYPEATEYKKLYAEQPEEFTRVLGDIIVESEIATQKTRSAAKEMKEEFSPEGSVTKACNRVWKNIEKTSQEGAIGYGKIALFGWLAITLVREGLGFLDPDRYNNKFLKFSASTINYGVLGAAAYGVYDNLLADPKERGKGTQSALNWARRNMGWEKVQPEGEVAATASLRDNPNTRELLDPEATKTFLATAELPAKNIIDAYKSTDKLDEIDPKKLFEGRAMSRKEKGLVKSIDSKKLYALIHGIIHSFEPKARENKMDVLPYVEREFVEKGDIDHPVTFDQMSKSAAFATLGVEDPKTRLAEKKSPEATPKAA
ncbi:MAG: hypothetical protein WC304_03600 [Candidatus Gracilibacteria bacterium]|jgi:hypothetical protein